MTKEEIINELYRKNIIKDIIYKYSESKDNLDDFEQDLYILLLQIPTDLLNELYTTGKLINWISATARRQIKSKTSYYYKTYKEFQDRSNDIYVDEDETSNS